MKSCKYLEDCEAHKEGFTNSPILAKDYYKFCRGEMGNENHKTCPIYDAKINLVEAVFKKLKGLENSLNN